jgi:diaminohydroxyphosphoribosylaminopyrimidine deaminase/5-amino-6-(5-phosphoribosylamino)uracil reductase
MHRDPWTDTDHQHMRAALALAEHALCLSNPNPRVGCVIVDAQHTVLGEGHTQAAGGPHAEVMALRDAQARGLSVAAATVYVTLEPCAHHGRTPPCADALVAAGVARVLIASLDPNPLVAGRGVARLREAGIEVQHGLLDTESRRLNIGFFSRMLRQRPWVRMKMAASLDGISALPNGQSQWITSTAARADGHAWRARACAVATGIGTVLSDNPRLDVRDAATPRQPHLVLIDSRLQTPADAALWRPERQVWLYHAQTSDALRPPGAQRCTALPNAQGKVDLSAMLRDLAAHEVNELHVEAGAALNASLLREGCVDELLIYLAPKWLGQGQGMSQFGPLSHLEQGLRLNWLEHCAVGEDWRIRATIERHDPDFNF